MIEFNIPSEIVKMTADKVENIRKKKRLHRKTLLKKQECLMAHIELL